MLSSQHESKPGEAPNDDPLLAHPDVSPLGEESLSPEDQALIQEGREDIEAGRTVSVEEIQAKYG